MKRPWLALDQHFVDDDRIVDLGADLGPGAIAVYITLLCSAKVAGVAGVIEIGYGALARKAYLPSGIEAQEIVQGAARLGLIEINEVDDRRVEVTFPHWERYQRDPFRAHRNGTSTEPQRDCGPTGTKTTTETKTKTKTTTTSSAKAADAPLSNLLADLIAKNGSRRPRIGKGWLNAERLLIEADDRDPSEAERLIRWCQADDFWRANVLSMPKFRERYDQLRLQTKRGRGGSGASVPPGEKRASA